jgi:hypothetical protein
VSIGRLIYINGYEINTGIKRSKRGDVETLPRCVILKYFDNEEFYTNRESR